MSSRVRRIVTTMLAMALGSQSAILALTPGPSAQPGAFEALAAGKAKPAKQDKKKGKKNKKQGGAKKSNAETVAGGFGLTDAKYNKLKSRLLVLKDPATSAKKKKALRLELDGIDKKWKTKYRDNPEFMTSIGLGQPTSAPTTPTPTPDAVGPGSTAPDSIVPDSVAPDSVAPDSIVPDSPVPDSIAKPASPTPAARTGTFPMRFVNQGELPLKLFEASNNSVGRPVEVIQGRSSITVPVKYGDHFVVVPWELLGDSEAKGRGHHPPVFIADDKPGTIILHGRIPYNQFRNSGNPPVTPDYDFNITGVDIRQLDLMDVPSGLDKGDPIFERFTNDSVDYDQVAGNTYIKYGFTYSATTRGMTTTGTHITSDFNNFSRNINASIGATVKNVSAGFGVTSSFTEREKNGQVYGFNRNVEANYVVGVNPTDAQLSQRFRSDILSMSPAAIIAKYGTHYPKEITYGSDVMSYIVMSTSEYTQAQSIGIDIKATISKSQETQVGRTQNDSLVAAGDGKGKWESGGSTEFADREVASGEVGFGFDESKSSGTSLSDKKGKTRWIGTRADPAPVKIKIDELYNLLTPQVFKDGVDRGLLAQKRASLKAATDGLINSLPNAGKPLPEAKVYSVALKNIEVVDEFDDANKMMRGKITLLVDGKPEKVLWEETEFQRKYEFRQGLVHEFPTNKRQFFVVRPDNQGRHPVLNIQATAKVHERDDLPPPNHEDIMNGQATIPLQVGTHEFEAEYYAFAKRNKVKIRLEIQEEAQAFADLAN